MTNGCKKGKAFEREIAIALRPVFPNARRHLENHEDDAKAGADLIFTGRFRFQLKRLRKYAPIAAIKQVTASAEFGEVPVLVTKGDHEPAMACLPLEDFVRLLADAGERE
jgi:hypothetical protein